MRSGAESHAGLRVAPPRSACARCGMRGQALCAAFDDPLLHELESVRIEQTLGAHATLFDEAEPASDFVMVVDGAVKLYKLLGDGRLQGLGFRFPGMLLGFEAGDVHHYGAETIVPSRVCRFPRRATERLRRLHPQLNERLLELAGLDLAEAQAQIVLLGRRTAEERLASFLLDIERLQVERGHAPSTIDLPMSRADMADYLGLTVETVSRSFSALRRAGVIALDGPTSVRVLDRLRMEQLAEPC